MAQALTVMADSAQLSKKRQQRHQEQQCSRFFRTNWERNKVDEYYTAYKLGNASLLRKST